MDTKQKSFPFRVEEDLLKVFQQCCKDNDLSASQVLRRFMRDYVKTNAQKDIFKEKAK